MYSSWQNRKGDLFFAFMSFMGLSFDLFLDGRNVILFPLMFVFKLFSLP